jgi:hypothetical protein
MVTLCSVHTGVLFASILLLWAFSSHVIKWAIFPYTSWLVYTQHHRDNNQRLGDEMVRLFKEMQQMLKENMILEKG